MHIQFSKMQGLGNDFILVDAIHQNIHITQERARQIADRKFGAGCDQVIFLLPSQSKNAHFFCRIFNADGSEVFQCGNGIRCLARFIVEKNLSDKRKLNIQTQQHSFQTELLNDDRVKVDMGEPIFDSERIPFIEKEEQDGLVIKIGQRDYAVEVLSMGNPHAVLFVEDLGVISLEDIAKQLREMKCFPEGVNVECATVLNRGELKLRVFERGAGETLACGSGACAAVVSGIKKAQLAQEVVVHMDGGSLEVIWQGNCSNSVQMIGPAQFVFEGEGLTLL